jgi:hypothetical protein
VVFVVGLQEAGVRADVTGYTKSMIAIPRETKIVLACRNALSNTA